MYIKSITLDGFKSYGKRVEITGFDPAFNAITGLNGTGKSNILDAICFVLGLTNLSNVRASNLQELIFKHGQAGVLVATVSITFDNSDKSQAPIGYENSNEITVTRQVKMGSKNKYLINGINVQNKRVTDLFCSVQLNINNPHFLIMQGRITKVLNMKPLEFLSMIEEAAGTSMYEAKKKYANTIICRKDAKLKELNNIIQQEIEPKLQKLKEERAQYQEHQQVVREIDGLVKLHKAHMYDESEKKSAELKITMDEVQEDINAKKNNTKTNEKKIKKFDKEIKEMNKKLDEENAKILSVLETELAKLERAEAASGSARRAAQEGLEAHHKREHLLQRALSDDVAALRAKGAALDEASSTFENLRVANEQSERALADAQQKFLDISSGIESSSVSLQDRLMAAKQEASEASTRITQSTMEKKAAEERLSKLRKEFASSSKQYQQDRDAIGRKQTQHDKLSGELAALGFSEERHAQLAGEVRTLQAGARGQRDRLDALAARLQRCHFAYSAPQPNFDDIRVSGTLVRLFDVNDPIFCRAIETAAGGKLYNVVVDTDVTSKLLLQHGNLQTRTTIIPLNKISGHVIDNRTLAIAQEVGGGPDNVKLALNLISYERHLQPAMSWVFGSTLICSDLSTARRVCYEPRVRKRCVTFDGDVCEPTGTLSGGARVKGVSVLVQIQELKQYERDLEAVELQLSDRSSELSAMQHVADKYHAIKQKYDMTSHELEVLRARLATTSHAQTHAEIESLGVQVAELTEAVERDKVTQKETAALARELEAKVKDIKGHREREFKKAEEALKKAKQDAQKHSAAWKNREQELETLRLETTELQQSVATSQSHLAEMQQAADDLQQTLLRVTEEHDGDLEAVKEMQARIEHQKTEISGRNTEVSSLMQRMELLVRTNQEINLSIQELEFKIVQLKTEFEVHQTLISQLEKEHKWILLEKQYFGAPNGAYDFENKQAQLASTRIEQLHVRRDKLARGLNVRAHTLLSKEEDQYKELISKKLIVEADRAKLVEVMEELDEKKRQTLVKACKQVNKDFGSIFSMLLPAAQAELCAVDGGSVLDGLEVRVGFSGTWKSSLSELSGGQRSLVALSLVLAMLLFKPAPLYILDEVDAALDLSHTQNIGLMLRNHFRHSQFIIVSLKDGMFNNANVLFRTRFVDGMSCVERVANGRR